MRNLTQEAIKLAEEDIISMNPHLRNKVDRQKLPPWMKIQVISALEILYEGYLNKLINEI